MFIFARQEVRGYFDLRYSRPFGPTFYTLATLEIRNT